MGTNEQAKKKRKSNNLLERLEGSRIGRVSFVSRIKNFSKNEFWTSWMILEELFSKTRVFGTVSLNDQYKLLEVVLEGPGMAAKAAVEQLQKDERFKIKKATLKVEFPKSLLYRDWSYATERANKTKRLISKENAMRTLLKQNLQLRIKLEKAHKEATSTLLIQ